MAKVTSYPDSSAVAPSSFLRPTDSLLAVKASTESSVPAGVYRASVSELASRVLAGQATARRTQLYSGVIGLTPKNNANRATARSSASLQPLARAALAAPSGKTSKLVGHLLYVGALLNFTGGAAAGYYCPWLAVESTPSAGLSFVFSAGGLDDTDLWANVSTETLAGINYSLWVRAFPLLQAKTLRVVLSAFE